MRVLTAEIPPPDVLDADTDLSIPSDSPITNLRATPARSLFRSALQAGLLGVPANLIPFGIGMVLTGVIAAVLHQRGSGEKLTTRTAARLGAMAGSISFIASAILGGLLLVGLNMQQEFNDRLMKAVEERAGATPDADMQAALQWLHKPEGFATALIFSLGVLLILSMVASALGCTITAAVSRDRGRGNA